jgi:ornithine carbamoyltransferase
MAAALLASARLLQQAEPGSDAAGLLRGTNLGLVCDSEVEADAILFREAGAALGASVSHLRPDLAQPTTEGGSGLLRTARLLGRLYDVIECQGLAPGLVRQLGRDAGVLVFDGLARAAHPTAQLAHQLAGADSLERKRQLIVQAVLLLELK